MPSATLAPCVSCLLKGAAWGPPATRSTMEGATSKRIQVLAGHLAVAADGPSERLAAQHTAANQAEQQYSVVLPETLSGNRWVVRR